MSEGKAIDRVLSLLEKFTSKKPVILSERDRKNAFVFHYYNEIIRYYNKLNFIIRILSQTKLLKNSIEKFNISLLLYITYRIYIEKVPLNVLIYELRFSNNLPNFQKKLLNSHNFHRVFNKIQTFTMKQALKHKTQIEKLSIKEAFPTFMIKNLSNVMSDKFLKENLDLMNSITEKTEISIRINTLTKSMSLNAKSDLLEGIQNDLGKDDIQFTVDKDIPEIIQVSYSDRKKIFKNKWFKTGNLIFQDKASAVICHILSPQPFDLIWDMCGAPGMKSSFIAQITNNKAKIISGEFHRERVYQMRILLNKFNVGNYYILNTDSINPPFNERIQFDRILLDPPCTGSGTLLINPELKWRQSITFLNQNVLLQKKLITTAIKFLKPNGFLVFSTCSLYPEEGESIILEYLRYLKPLELPNWISPGYKINNSIIPGTGRLFPSIHHTQGFFIGKFKKKKNINN